MDGWEVMGAEEFRDRGLLYEVNRAVLWPLGVAIRLTTGDGPATLDVVVLSDPETIVEGPIDVAREPGGCHPSVRFAHFAEQRIVAMPSEMEQETAIRALRRVVPGVMVSPLHDDVPS